MSDQEAIKPNFFRCPDKLLDKLATDDNGKINISKILTNDGTFNVIHCYKCSGKGEFEIMGYNVKCFVCDGEKYLLKQADA